ncbi:hypothetical protein Tco_0412904 [Tanacetum coccineum]
MLRDLWDPELLGLDREMHYIFLFIEPRCLRNGLPLRIGVSLTPGPLDRVVESSAAGTARQYRQKPRDLGYGGEIIYSELDDARHDKLYLEPTSQQVYRIGPFHRPTKPSDGGGGQSISSRLGTSLDALRKANRRDDEITYWLKADASEDRDIEDALKIEKEPQDPMIELHVDTGPANDPESHRYRGGKMFPEETDKIERYVGGMPDLIYSSVVASKPKTMQEAIEMATELMDRRINTFAKRKAENKRKFERLLPKKPKPTTAPKQTQAG